MLTAILHGKAGRVEVDGHVLSWRELFRKREDLLTSVLFGRMPYLSEAVQAAFLRALLGTEYADELGRLSGIEFWPKLSEGEARRYVEPDVLIEYPRHRLLIEVKPPFGGSQNTAQWRAEVEALHRQDDEPKPIILLALGQNHGRWRDWAEALEQEFSLIALRVVCLDWADLLRRLGPVQDLADARDQYVLRDWHEAFRLFGMVDDTLPFEELLPLCQAGQGIREQLNILQGWTSITKTPAPSAGALDWDALLPLVQRLEKGEQVQWA